MQMSWLEAFLLMYLPAQVDMQVELMRKLLKSNKILKKGRDVLIWSLWNQLLLTFKISL